MSDESDSGASCRLKCKISDNEFFAAAPLPRASPAQKLSFIIKLNRLGG